MEHDSNTTQSIRIIYINVKLGHSIALLKCQFAPHRVIALGDS